jgi:phospholipid transport system substrate-binding protein
MRTSSMLWMVAALLMSAAQPGLQAEAAPPAAQAGTAASSDNPSQVVQETAQSILKALEGNRDAYRKDPAKMEQLVSQYLLPHLNTQAAAKAVLGPHWNMATPEQRQRFVDAFYHSMLANYGAALAEFTADRLKVYPTNVEPGAKFATVRTEIRRDNGDRVQVDYLMGQTAQGWQALDVKIDGISYVKSYRDDFASQIDQQGLDAVIARLEKGEKPSAIGKASGGGKT